MCLMILNLQLFSHGTAFLRSKGNQENLEVDDEGYLVPGMWFMQPPKEILNQPS